MEPVFAFVVGILTSFIALTAIGGGIAILTGLDKFPPEWLEKSPFKSYTIPALLLSVAVGGSALIAAIFYFTGHPLYLITSMFAGAVLAGYILVEIRILDQGEPGATTIEKLYLGLGTVVFVLSGQIWLF